MKWGVRRYQNPDGTLTPAGKARYNSQSQQQRNVETARQMKLTIKARKQPKRISGVLKMKTNERYMDSIGQRDVLTNIFLERPDQYDKLKKAAELSKKSNYYRDHAHAYDLTGEGTPSDTYWDKYDKMQDAKNKAVNDYLSSVIYGYDPKAKVKNWIWDDNMTVSELGKTYFNELYNVKYNEIEKAINSNRQTKVPKTAKAEKHGASYSKAEQKQIKNEYKENVRSEEKKLSAKYEAKEKELREEIDRLAKKYDFDLDDGGGGKTKEDEKAGAKYIQLWEEIDDLDRQRRNEAIDISLKKIEDKYGKGGTAYAKKAWMGVTL